MATRPPADQANTPPLRAHKLPISLLKVLTLDTPTGPLADVTSTTPIQHFKEYPVLVKLVTDGWAKGTPAEKPVGKLLEKLTSGTTHNTKVYQEQLEAFIAELKVQKAEAAVKKMTDPVDEGGCGGSVEGLLMHLSDILVMYYSRC